MSSLTIGTFSYNQFVNSGVTATVDGAPLTNGMVINEGQTITAVAPEGQLFYFRTVNSQQITSIYLESSDTAGGNKKRQSFILSADRKTATLVLGTPPDNNRWGNFTVGVRSATTYDYTLKQSDIDYLNSSLVDLKVNGASATLGTGINYGDYLTATCANNRAFKLINIASYTVSSIYFSGKDTAGQSRYLGFELSEDNKTATLLFKSPTSNPLTWSNLISETDEVTEVVGNNSVYLINDDILTNVIAERFGTTGDTTLDYGVYILSLISLPFTIPENIILDENNISLGNKELTVSAPQLSTDNIAFDMGSITVPIENDNFLDYANTTAIIHLPRTPPINLDVNYVVGHTVSIEYVVDCYTGIAQVNLRSSKNEDIFFTTSVDIGISVPYITTTGTTRLENNNVKVGGENGVKNPYIEILRNEALLKDGLFTVPIIDESILNGYNGFARIEEINLSSKATSLEKDMILSRLRSGVIIK